MRLSCPNNQNGKKRIPVKYHAPGEKLPKSHQLLLEFEDHSHMSCTVQMWGAMCCYPVGGDGLPRDYNRNECPDPLTNAFDAPYFDTLWNGVKPTLSAKAFLTTEQRIPGLGNGVLQDILFNARIHPKGNCKQLERGNNGRFVSFAFEGHRL